MAARQYEIDTFAQWNKGSIAGAVVTLGGSGLTSSKVSDIKFTDAIMGSGNGCKLISINSGDGSNKHLKLNGVYFEFSKDFAPNSEFIEIGFYAGDINSNNELIDEFKFIYKRVPTGNNKHVWLNNLEAKTWLVQHAGRTITIIMKPANGTFISISQTSLDKSVQWNYNGVSPLRCPNPTFPLKIGADSLKMNAIDENTLSRLFYYTYTESRDYVETTLQSDWDNSVS